MAHRRCSWNKLITVSVWVNLSSCSYQIDLHLIPFGNLLPPLPRFISAGYQLLNAISYREKSLFGVVCSQKSIHRRKETTKATHLFLFLQFQDASGPFGFLHANTENIQHHSNVILQGPKVTPLIPSSLTSDSPREAGSPATTVVPFCALGS